MSPDVLLYHIVQGSHYSAGLLDGQYLPTLVTDRELRVTVTGDGRTRKSQNRELRVTVTKDGRTRKFQNREFRVTVTGDGKTRESRDFFPTVAS